MKFLLFLIIALTAGFMFSSCQKEFSSESGNAHGSLKSDASGDCFPVMIHGNFKKDSIIKDTNYAQIQVNITQTGTYFIKTDTVNGYSFSAAGFVAATGTNTIRLLASGKPIIPGVDLFTVKFDTSQCEFNVTVTGSGGGGGGGTAAVFTLTGSPTTCTGATQTTNFYAAIPTTPANTVTVNADVTVAGTYTITASTTPANGLTFTATGSLVIGTNQPIVLVADGGTPSTAGSIPYTLTTTSPASNCGFNLTVQAATAPAAFTFDCSTPVYTGTYQANTPTAGGTVKIFVTSLAGGSYNITSAGAPSSNNVTFMGSGVLPASATPQPVTLFASGTPMAAGTFTYTLSSSGATGTCTIAQTYSSPATDFIKADINGVSKTFNVSITGLYDNTSLPGFTILDLDGDAATIGNEAINLSVTKSGTSIVAGTYTTNQAPPGTIVVCDYTDPAGIDYIAQPDGTVPPTPYFTITISSINPTTPGRVTGTFSGVVKDNGGMGPGFKMITNGSFSVPL